MCARLDTTGLLADVMYAILRGDAQVGRERCCLYRHASGGHWMTSEVELTRPFPLHQYVEIQAGADWRIESVSMRLSGHVQRDATHIADGGTWRATIQSDEATVERTVPFTRETRVEFDAVWACAIAIHRLPLTPGQSREVDVIRIQPASLEPMPARWRYGCIGPERITTPAGKKNATHFVCGEYHLWADSRGIIVATHNAVSRSLLEYHWLG
jgi:hypothetical protein